MDLTFIEVEAKQTLFLHDDILVVTPTLAGLNMHRILVGNGSSMNVLYRQALDKKKIDNLAVRPINMPLSRFSGSLIMPMGKAILPLSMGELLARVTKMTKFLMVDNPSAYNVIIRRPAIHNFRAVLSLYRMVMKFSTK